MRVVEPRHRWQIPVEADKLVCSALAYSRHLAPDSEGHALRSALIDRLVTLCDDDGEARRRLVRLDTLPDEEGWTRWQTAVFVARAWDDEAAIDLAFALWDTIGEATYRLEVRNERPRLTLAKRYGWPEATSATAGDTHDAPEDRRRLRRARVRWALLELPLWIYADFDARGFRGQMAVRARVIGAFVVLNVLGAGIGAGIATLRGLPVEDGLVAGGLTATVAALIYLLLMLSMVAGLSLMDRSRARTDPDGARSYSRSHDAVVATFWVAAVFAGIITALVVLGSAGTWFEERAYQGPIEQTTGTVLSWDDGHAYRTFLLEYEVDGQVWTGHLNTRETDLTIHSVVGDTVALEYPVAHPDRIRGAGEAAKGRESNAAFPWLTAVGIGVTAALAATATGLDRRRRAAVHD